MTQVPVRKLSKTCDACKARKVRCSRSDKGDYSSCDNCISRKAQCHYSYTKPPRKRKQPPTDPGTNDGSNVLGSETVARTPKRQTTPSARNTPLCSTLTAAGQNLHSSNGLLGSERHREADGRMSLAGGNGNRYAGGETALSEQFLSPSIGGSPQLYVDLLLADRQTPARYRDENSAVKLTEFFGMHKALSMQQVYFVILTLF
ncbi:hypothetical protein VTN02DRAFT_1720 [Thermoascus thermophilus]